MSRSMSSSTDPTTLGHMTRVALSYAPSGVAVYQVSTPGLGDHSYLLTDGTAAAVIDPQRDIDRFEQGLTALGAPLTLGLETHVHNDYVSGGRDLTLRHDARHVLPAGAGYAFEHHAVSDGDEVTLGELTIRALHTPGHTPHHTSYAVLADDEVILLFSGGSALVGACGRTDLISPDLTETLTRSQYRSVRKLLGHPRPTVIGPTHGQGSFCSASAASSETYTTVEKELTRNPAALARDEDEFVRTQLSGLLDYPDYYAQMAGFNRSGATAWEPGEVPTLTAEEIAAKQDQGVRIIDGRSRYDFAQAHIPGSVNIELNDTFSTYLGWLFPFGTRFVLVLDEQDDPQAAFRQAARIGIDTIDGVLDGGMGAWRSAGKAVSSYSVTDVDGLKKAYDDGGIRVLDVRQNAEWADGHVPGSVHVHVPALPDELDRFRDEATPVYVICRSGHRASMAASLLDGAEIPAVLVDGGVPDWTAAGNPVEQ